MIFPPKLLEQNGLRYSESSELTIRRRRRGKGFSYVNEGNATITCTKRRSWYQSLAVPPVYEDVHFCWDLQGHLQAKGVDTTGSQQYFYHPKWESLRDEHKFNRLKLIGEQLPRMRRTLNRLLREKQDDKTYVLAGITKVLDRTGLRPGNPESSEHHNTYGVTTLKNDHFVNEDGEVLLEFTGKGGVEIEREIVSQNIKYILEDFYNRPGEMLFQYKKDGLLHQVSPAQVNNFIDQLSNIEMTAKEFRTWRASALFVKFWLQKNGDNKTLTALLESVAEFIGNTPSTLRNSYIHPLIIDKKKDPSFSIHELKVEKIRGMRKSERYMMSLLAAND